MSLFRRGDNAHTLAVAMSGVKMGDRFVQIGCADGGRLAAIAAKTGMSGHAVAIVPDEAAAARARKGAAQAGVLVEVEIAPPRRLPAEDGSFDLAVVEDTDGRFSTAAAEDQAAAVGELVRILRPGGRVVVIGVEPRAPLGALLARMRTPRPRQQTGCPAAAALQAHGFGLVRTLAEREGLAFVEGLKPRSPTGPI
jgi:ubiquinone/menaquinone biosynthesis C-methylase UbiE